MNKDIKPLNKPLFRGHSHQSAFFFVLGIASILLLKTYNTHSFISALVYCFSLVSLFGISALCHRPTWRPEQRLWMKRLDHAAIYILIAGTSTPICLLALPPLSGIKLLQLVWGASILGIVQSLFWVTVPKWFSSILYITVGCLLIPFLPELKMSLKFEDLILILTGGLIYIIGAIIYALKKPNPFPLVFGYHEIFHLFVIIGAGLHFIVIYNLLF